ncbi:MAG: hypothetical protein ACK4R7_03415 [Fervidobacterium sp.]
MDREMSQEELERKLLTLVQKIDDHIERYENEIEEVRRKLEKVTYELEDTWSILRTTFVVSIIMFLIMAITWFFPFQVRSYGYLTMDDVRRKVIAISLEALIFGLIIIFSIYSALYRRFRK